MGHPRGNEAPPTAQSAGSSCTASHDGDSLIQKREQEPLWDGGGEIVVPEGPQTDEGGSPDSFSLCSRPMCSQAWLLPTPLPMLQ